MSDQHAARPGPAKHACLLVLLIALASSVGCAGKTGAVQASSPELATYAQLVMPTRIKIQPWTQPVSFAGQADADGLEVLLAAYDTFGEETKAVGTLHFELYTRRQASADHLGKQIAFWPIELDSRESLARYWERSVRFYRFPLHLAAPPLAPGEYILCATLSTPTEQRLFDEYEFTYEAGSAVHAKGKK